MKVQDLKDKANININFIFYDRRDYSHKPIEYNDMCREDYIDFLNREIYMIFPTNSLNTLEVALF